MAPETLAGRTIGGYNLIERVGEGGTATVYRAQHDVHGQCAVKTLRERLRTDPTAVKRFLREAEYGGRVRHPGVVRTFDYGQQGGIHYLALEWVNGAPLGQAVLDRGALAPDEVVEIVRQLADALAATHAVGIIHRDLKPENIVYDSATRCVKLLDFGIARDAEEPSSERLTRAGFFVGSLQYVSPEALSGELVAEAADIYSLATITYFLLTGTHPHPGRTPRELFHQLLSEPPRPLNQAGTGRARFPAALESAVMKGLARNPGERQASVIAFAAEMAHAMGAPETQPTSNSGGLFSAIRSWMGGKEKAQ